MDWLLCSVGVGSGDVSQKMSSESIIQNNPVLGVLNFEKQPAK